MSFSACGSDSEVTNEAWHAKTTFHVWEMPPQPFVSDTTASPLKGDIIEHSALTMDHQNQYIRAMKEFYNLCALWSPDQPPSVKPGACGYFDAQGDWNTIVDPTQSDQVDSTLTRPLSLPNSKTKSLGRWGPTCSEGIKWAQTELDTPIEYVRPSLIQQPFSSPILIRTPSEFRN